MTNQLPPVVLLHGWGGSFASTYEANGWCTALELADRPFLKLDLPGHGRNASTAPDAYADMAGLVAERLPRYPIDVVGYSLGAKIALAIATQNRSAFRRIVLAGVGDNIFAPEPSGEMLAQILIQPSIGHVPEHIQALARYARANGNDPEAMAAILRRPPNPSLSASDLPTGEGVLIVNGDADVIAGQDVQLRAAMPRAAYLKLEGIDHLSLPGTAEFRRSALSFLCAS